MRSVRRWWRRLRGWWLLTAAAVVTAVLSAVGQLYPGIVVAIAVAVGGVVAGVVSDRGRAHLTARTMPAGLHLGRVDRLTDPIRLRVHRAASVDGDPVPPFVERDRLPELVEALRAGGFVLVVGDSTAGKTRLAFEAMKVCLPGHMCVVPNGTVNAGITAAMENRPSVLWLDDLDRYLGAGGLSVVDVRALAAKGVVVLATIRTHERERLSERHDLSRDHAGRRLARAGREILDTVTVEIRLPRRWSEREREAAEAFADDPRIAAALANADRHGLAEHMAAGPELVRDLKDARDTTTSARGAALVTAAVDLRRTGYHRPVPVAVLEDLHTTYLRDNRAESWDEALDWATRPLHATSSLLEPMGDDEYLAFDYLLEAAVQDPETPPVPDAVWRAIVDFAEPTALVEVAWEAVFLGNVDYVHDATIRAVALDDFVAAAVLAEILGDAGRETEAAERLEEIITVAENIVSPIELVRMRRMLAWQVGEKAGRLGGDPQRALTISRDLVRDSVAALGERHPDTLAAQRILARQLGAAGQPAEALSLARAVVDDATREVGPDDHLTLSARFEVAVWIREVDGATAAIPAFGELLDDLYALADTDIGLVADVQWNLGGALTDAARPEEAVEFLDAAVQNSGHANGPNHLFTLDMRLSHIDAVSDAGDLTRAVDLADTLAQDSTRTVGPTHVITLTARGVAAACLAEAGDRTAALQRFEPLLADLAHLPADHWLVTEVHTRYRQLQQP